MLYKSHSRRCPERRMNLAKKGNTIHEIKCAACGRHISFTHDQKQAKEELFCSRKCVKKIIKKEAEVKS